MSIRKIDIDEVDIKVAIEFLKTMGYEWDGTICEEGAKVPTTIYPFDYPRTVKLINSKNEEEFKGLILYTESTGEGLPDCELYKNYRYKDYSEARLVPEMSFTKEWIEFLNKKGFEF